MDTKLTLKLDEQVIQQAKIYAASQNKSLSGLVESYLKLLVAKGESDRTVEEIQISPFVKSMTLGNTVPTNLDPKEEYRNHLTEKYR